MKLSPLARAALIITIALAVAPWLVVRFSYEGPPTPRDPQFERVLLLGFSMGALAATIAFFALASLWKR